MRTRPLSEAKDLISHSSSDRAATGQRATGAASRRTKWGEETGHNPEFKPATKPIAPTGNAPASPLLTIKEAAHYLRVSESWLAKKRMSGDGPAYIKYGRSVRYLESALIEWMKSRRRWSTSGQ